MVIGFSESTKELYLRVAKYWQAWNTFWRGCEEAVIECLEVQRLS